MKNKTWRSGKLPGRVPYIEFGKGAQTLVILPPMTDALVSVRTAPCWLRFLFRRFAREYRVVILSRPRFLGVGCTTREMAVLLQPALESLNRPFHLMGVSLGGMIAQHAALLFPDRILSLTLVCSAGTMGPGGVEIARRWIPWAREGNWAAIYDDTIGYTYRRMHAWIYAFTRPFVIGFIKRSVKSPDDFIISGQAAMIHNTESRLGEIHKPVLMIAGNRDGFFPEALFLKTAGLIPDCRLKMIEGAGHGVLEEHLNECFEEIRSFTAGIDTDPALKT